jgi:LPXTG-site transpeptidase (sortase) family protein
MREMSNTVFRVANGLIWFGLALMAWGGVMALPFVWDTLQAASAPAAMSFVITLEPPLAQATPSPAVAAPSPWVAAAVTAVAATPGVPAPATATFTATPAAPIVLPDNSTASAPVSTRLADALPTATILGQPPDRLVIRSIELDAPVQVVGWRTEQVGGGTVSVWDVPDRRAAGWLQTTAPAGQKGNTVLDGHHNINGQVFKRLVDLKPRDVIELYAGDKLYQYAVTEKHILPDRDEPLEVRLANARWIEPTDDERLTLVTCWPFTNNTHRLIIVARPLARMPNLGGGKVIE